MVLIKHTTACISLLVLLCTAWLSTARLHPTPGSDEVNGISSTKAGVATATIIVNNNKEKSPTAIEKNSKKLSLKRGNANSSRASVEDKRSLRSTRLSDEVGGGGGFVAFTADYHSPRHHPPKNNK